jgi:HTH-type transcriptional regulator/antitoxin HipB
MYNVGKFPHEPCVGNSPQEPHVPENLSQAFRIYTPASIGAAIRHYRKDAGLTQAELAERSGLTRDYLSDLETGQPEQLKRLLRVLRQLGVRMTLEKADW